MPEYSVAIVGATGLVGRELVEVLEQRTFPLRELKLYASLRTAGDTVDCGSRHLRVDVLDGASFDDTDIVFLAAGEQVSAEWMSRLESTRATVIDLTQLFATADDVPLVVPEVNPAAVGDHVGRGIIASPDPLVIAAAVVLAPLRDAAGLRQVVLSSFEPASGAGRGGIETLQKQTFELMQGRDAEAGSFPRRLAFNLVPHLGELLAGGWSKDEAVAATALRRILDLPDLPISVTRVRAAHFYGLGVSLHADLHEALPLEEVRSTLRGAPGLLLRDDEDPAEYPTPADVVGEDATFVGRVRCDEDAACVDAWVGLDNLRKGAAVNAVQIAEILVRDHL